jgi:hypothetical protein
MRLRTGVGAEARPEGQHALFLGWSATNCICAKKLILFLPTLIEAPERREYLYLYESSTGNR